MAVLGVLQASRSRCCCKRPSRSQLLQCPRVSRRYQPSPWRLASGGWRAAGRSFAVCTRVMAVHARGRRLCRPDRTIHVHCHRLVEESRSCSRDDVDVYRARVRELLHLGNARSRGPVLEPRRAAGNVAELGALVIVTSLQVAAVHLPPLARVLHAVPLSVGDWAIVMAAALIPAVAGQILKMRRAGGGSETGSAQN